MISRTSVWHEIGEYFVQTYDYAMLYAEADDAEPMYEGPARILANGWIEVENGRLFSPEAVHRIDSDVGGEREDARERS